MTVSKQHFILIADFLMVISVWLFSLHMLHVVSLLMLELFTSFFFLIFYIFKNKPKEDRFLPSMIITTLSAFMVFYGILNAFHMFLPPIWEHSHFGVMYDIFQFNSFWFSFSYLLVMALILISNIVDVMRYRPSKSNDRSVLKANHVLVKFVLLALSIVVINIMFPTNEDSSGSEVTHAMKVISTVVILSFAYAEFKLKTKNPESVSS